MTHGASDLAATVQPGGFATGAAYFTGKRDEEKAEGAPAAQAPGLDRLEKEIAGRKGSK